MRLTYGILAFAALAQLTLAQSKIKSQFVQAQENTVAVKPMLFQEETPQEKSVLLAIAYSVVLPGMGELYAGSFSTGKYLTMADAGLWIAYAGFVSHGNWLRDDARSFAAEHASVNLEGKEDQFFVDMGNFNTLDAFNQQKLRNREYDLMYSGASYNWTWDTDANRDLFKSMRIRSDETYRNSRFLLAGVVVNRIISAFLAGRAVAAYNRRVRYEGVWRLQLYPSGGLLSMHGVELRVTREF